MLLLDIRIRFKCCEAEKALKIGVLPSVVDAVSVRPLSQRREDYVTYWLGSGSARKRRQLTVVNNKAVANMPFH